MKFSFFMNWIILYRILYFNNFKKKSLQMYHRLSWMYKTQTSCTISLYSREYSRHLCAPGAGARVVSKLFLLTRGRQQLFELRAEVLIYGTCNVVRRWDT